MRRLCLIFLLCSLPIFQVFAQTSESDPLARCGHDPAVLTAAIEANGWAVDDLIQFYWSPNCRYLSMRLPSSHGDPGTTIVWDADANLLVGTLDSFAAGNTTSRWDSSGDYLVIPANDVGTYLWHVPLNRQMLINPYECGLMYTDWDYEHHRLYATSPIEWGDTWCSPLIAVGGLSIYDLDTGETIVNYPTHGYSFEYEYAGDGRYLVITNYPGAVQVFDAATGTELAEVRVDEGGGVAHHNPQIALSPDGRYLAVGMNYLRIWDLTALAADFYDQVPTYRYEGPAQRIQSLGFVDNQTIETTIYNGETQRWDVITGAELPWINGAA